MKPLIIANWKMNPQTLVEAKKLFNLVKRGTRDVDNVGVVICPPFVYLSNIQHLKSNIQVGAQNCFWEEKGAFTGEISAPMLKNLGAEYVIIGHSDRRKYFDESDEMINKKLKAALKAGLKPILCVGETEKERKNNKTNQVIRRQLVRNLRGIENWKLKIENLAIAYEPVWAIGTGNPCRVEDASRAFVFIQNVLAKIYNSKITARVRIIYGGSVNSQNAAGYIKKAKMHGLLVGGASLDPKEFVKIIKSCEV